MEPNFSHATTQEASNEISSNPCVGSGRRADSGARLASIAAAAPLSDQQINRQIENRLAKDDALENVTVSVQESVVSLSGTVPSLWSKKQAIAEAREVEDVAMVVRDALDVERAESDLFIAKQIGKQIRRVSIPALLVVMLVPTSRKRFTATPATRSTASSTT